MHAPRRFLAVILVIYTLLALAFNALTPLGEAPDEVSHFSYVRHLAATWELPKPEGTVFGEVFQPPLYYVLAAPVTAWLPPGPLPVEANADWILGDPYRGFNVLIQTSAARWPWRGEALAWHLVRLLSTLFGLVTIACTAAIAGATFPARPWAAVAAAAFVAFLPQFLFLSGAVNNDTLAAALGALFLWQMTRAVRTALRELRAQASWQQWALLGLIGGLGIWTKTSGWLFAGTGLAAAILVVWWRARHPRYLLEGRIAAPPGLHFGRSASRDAPDEEQLARVHAKASRPWREPPAPLPLSEHERGGEVRQVPQPVRVVIGAAALGAPMIVAWLAVAAPWLLWNTIRYGDPLGWRLMHQVTDARVEPLGPAGWADIGAGIYRSFWAGFGGAAHLHFPDAVPIVTLLVVALAALGLLRLAGARATLPEQTRLFLPLFALHLLLTIIALAQWTRTVLGTDQGRLLFPALPAIAVLFAGGLAGLSWGKAPRERAFALLAGSGMLVMALVALTFVLGPLRAPPLPPAHPQAAAAEWRIGDELVLERLAFPWTVDSHLPPGASADLFLLWRADRRPGDLRLRLQLIDEEGRPVWLKEGTPSAGRDTTDQWAPGSREHAAWHRVTIPPGSEPGWYRLMLSVHRAQSSAPLPLRDAAGTFLGEQVMVGQVTVIEPGEAS